MLDVERKYGIVANALLNVGDLSLNYFFYNKIYFCLTIVAVPTLPQCQTHTNGTKHGSVGEVRPRTRWL